MEDFLYVCSGDGMIVENSLFSPQNTCHHLVGSQYSVENYLRNTHAVQFSSCQYWSVIATLWGGHWGSLLPCKGKKTQILNHYPGASFITFMYLYVILLCLF